MCKSKAFDDHSDRFKGMCLLHATEGLQHPSDAMPGCQALLLCLVAESPLLLSFSPDLFKTMGATLRETAKRALSKLIIIMHATPMNNNNLLDKFVIAENITRIKMIKAVSEGNWE